MTANNDMQSVIEAFEQGVGLYTPRETSRYAKIHPTTLRTWFFHKDGPKFRNPELVFEDTKLLTFVDFVEALYVRILREKYRISFPVIRAAIDTAKELENIQFPFAHPDYRTAVIGKEINIIKEDDPERLIALSNRPGQTSDRTILHQFIDDLEFDDEDLVVKYIAYRNERERVLISPNYCFGEPILESCGYPAETIWGAVEAEGGIKNAAEAYGVDESTVRTALEYKDSLMLKAA